MGNSRTTYEIDGVEVSQEEYSKHLAGLSAKVSSCRPRIGLDGFEQLTHNGDVCRVVLSKHLIRVACTDVTPEALRHLLKRYDDHFGKSSEIVLQAGEQ